MSQLQKEKWGCAPDASSMPEAMARIATMRLNMTSRSNVRGERRGGAAADVAIDSELNGSSPFAPPTGSAIQCSSRKIICGQLRRSRCHAQPCNGTQNETTDGADGHG